MLLRREGESKAGRGRGPPQRSDNEYNRAVESGKKPSASDHPGPAHSDLDRSEPDRSQNNAVRDRPAGRILGLDVGARRIGVAVSDPLGITAQGLETLHRQNKRHDFEHLQQVIREYKIKEIVVGLPLRMSGAEGIQSEKMRVFAEELRKKFGLPVHLWDERLTSAEANRFLRETELSIEKRGKAVDRMAAVLILQGWMEQRAGAASGFRLPASTE